MARNLGESLDMGDEEDSSGARGTKLQVARGILAWRVPARSLRRRNAHRFPKIGAACAMGYVDVFGCHLGNELLRSCLAETRMFTYDDKRCGEGVFWGGETPILHRPGSVVANLRFARPRWGRRTLATPVRTHPGWMRRLSQCDGSRFGRQAPGWGPGPARAARSR